MAIEYVNAFEAAREAGDHKATARYLIGLADCMFVAEQARTRRKLTEEKRKREREALRRAERRKYDFEDDLLP